jgi:hypothetical protein
MPDAREAVSESRFALMEIKQEANQELATLQAQLDDLQQRVDLQSKIVAHIGAQRNAYVRDSQRWERNGAPEPEGEMLTREWVIQVADQRTSRVQVALPWKQPSDPRYPKRTRRVMHDSDSSESDEAPLSTRQRGQARAAAGAAGAAGANRESGSEEEEEREDVVEVGERTWAQRDAALRQRAVPLDSCVDQVFRRLGLEPDEATEPTNALFGGSKGPSNVFQPIRLLFHHEKRTTFDGGANVRAQVRFRMEGKYAVAWLDDLHKLHHHLRGPGDMQGAWQLPGGAPYTTRASMHEFVGGVKIWRVENDAFRIQFYGPRSRLPGFMGGEPEAFAVYAEVPMAKATKWDPNAWKLLGSERHFVTFRSHLKNLFPRIMSVLLFAPEQLVAQTPHDERVRSEWAKGPVVAMYQQ